MAYPYHKCGERVKTVIVWGCLNVLIFFFGLRGPVGDDYGTYLQVYERMCAHDALTYGPGYWALCFLLKAAGLPFHCLLFALSMLTNALLVWFAWKSRLNVPLVLAVFFAVDGIANEIDFIRNAVSIVLFANSIEFVVQRRVKPFVALNAVGCLFHYSSVVYLLLYPLLVKGISRAYCVVCMVAGLMFSLARWRFLDVVPVLFGAWDVHYIDYIAVFGQIPLSFTLGSVERLLTGAMACVLYGQLTQHRYGEAAVTGFMCYYLCYGVLSAYGVLATRLANLFVFSYWLLWPLMLAVLPRRGYRVAWGIFMFVYMMLRLLSLSHMPQWRYTLLT